MEPQCLKAAYFEYQMMAMNKKEIAIIFYSLHASYQRHLIVCCRKKNAGQDKFSCYILCTLNMHPMNTVDMQHWFRYMFEEEQQLIESKKSFWFQEKSFPAPLRLRTVHNFFFDFPCVRQDFWWANSNWMCPLKKTSECSPETKQHGNS